MTADEKNQVSLGHRPIGARSGVGSHNADRKRVVVGNGFLAVKRGRYGD